uniref:HTH psq-type domain-containing protein n=1 Tax=Panagrellus redivivus TaxID=6233 RepID=A0A7E4V5M6_PANRE
MYLADILYLIMRTTTELCNGTCASQRKIQSRELLRGGSNLLISIGLEQISLHLRGSRHVKKFDDAVKGLAKHSQDWTPEESCSHCFCKQSESKQLASTAFNFDNPSKKKSIRKAFDFDSHSSDSVDLSSSDVDFGDLFSFLPHINSWPMSNTMFPPWPVQHPGNNHPLPMYPVHHPRAPFDSDAMQNYVAEWQSQLLNMNMFSYMMRNQSSVNPMLAAHQHLAQQFQQKPEKPFILKDVPNKAFRVAKASASPESSFLNTDEEMPLDLSSKTRPKLDEDDQASVVSPDLNDKSSSPEFNEGGIKVTKRNYTQQALNDAVSEILSGRLGTRRASVVYGIPRSTLRNKIYKLESIDEGDTKKKRPRKTDEPKPDEPFDPLPMHKTQSMPAMDSPFLPFMNANSVMMSQLTPNFPNAVNPFTDFFKQYVDKQSENHGKEMSISPNGENSFDDLEKRPRPKRGQYRKYDKGALEKAVLSVRKGEMSVHRAGSFYGVPHSTLEYKVKERNLMRNKRRCTVEKKESPELTAGIINS